MFPIRVLVQAVEDQQCTKCANHGSTVVDSYAIVNGQTPLSQLVDTVLIALGLQHLSYGAKGMIQLNNWKPLPFDSITDDLENTTENVLKDISNHATLKIVTKAADSALAECVRDLRERLLRALLNRNPQILSTIKNVQLKDFVSLLLEDESVSNVTPEQIQGFNHWLDELTNTKPSVNDIPTTNGNSGTDSAPPWSSSGRFNPQLEIPKLERWFKDNQNPTRQKLLQYVQILNTSNYRRHHNKVSYQNICNWFSNARAMHRNNANHSPTTNGVAKTEPRNTSFDFNELLRRQQEKLEEAQNIEVQAAIKQETTPENLPVSSEMDVQNNNCSEQVSPVSSEDLSSVGRPLLGGCLSALSPSVTGVGRSRLMFDPLSELPLLEKWFEENPHPSWVQIDQYTETLNALGYRQTYPPISTHNVKIWFKNRRAKSKRMLGTDTRKFE